MKEKVLKELKSIFWTSLYFFCWFGALMVIKILLLREYQIEFVGLSIVVVGALVVAKVVLILEYVRIPFTKSKPAWVEVVVRTLFYLAGVFVIMVLEKTFEARHEYGGMLRALQKMTESVDWYHVWVNIICVMGALLFFNIWTVVKMHYGVGMFRKMMTSPLPGNKKD